jgi:hypothetical protein
LVRNDSASAIFTLLILVATSIYAYFAFLQWDATKQAAEAAQVAANIASATLRHSEQSFRIDQRPYLVADSPQFSVPGLVPNTPLKVSNWFSNIGRTPANKVFTYLKLVPYRIVKSRHYFRTFMDSVFAEIRKRNSAGRNELKTSETEEDIAPAGRFFSTNQNPVTISAQDITEIQAGENNNFVLFYVGIISYTDAYGGNYATEFCYFFIGTDPKTWHICDSHNTIK